MNNFSHRNPVLLVHGINDTGAIFRKWLLLDSVGWSVYDLDLLPSNGDLGLDQFSKSLICRSHLCTRTTFRYSWLQHGRNVSRYYVQRLWGIDRVQRFITLASPHHGTWMAYLCESALVVRCVLIALFCSS